MVSGAICISDLRCFYVYAVFVPLCAVCLLHRTYVTSEI